MNKNDLQEYVDYLLQTAMYKVDNISDAEDLVQETLLAALHAIEYGRIIDNPKSWLVTVLHRKFYDKLRLKYRLPMVSIDIADDIRHDDLVYERLEQSIDADNIRRCLAYLTELYRDVMVRYYMHGESVKQIATALNIPENTVKSRLDTGRKHIRKEFAMENYSKQSYEPENLWLSNSGQCGINNEPFSLVGSDKIAMNILILAYDKPITLLELAKAIGITTTYIEPIVDRLVDGELMKRVSDKVYTDFIIYNENDRTANLDLEKELAAMLYRSIWVELQLGLDELREQDFYKEQGVTKQIKLESFFVIRTIQNAVNSVRNEACGGILPFNLYPERPNGGKWYAMGSRYPGSYNWNESTYQKYYISGEACNSLQNYCGLKEIVLCEYDSELGKTHQGYCSLNHMNYSMSGIDVMKMHYAIYLGKEEDLPIINLHCFDNIQGFQYLNFLRKDDNARVVVDIPVISMAERWRIYEISEKFSNIIAKKYHSEFMKLMQNKVKVPKHLTSVPDFQKLMHCCSTFPMQVILRGKKDGLFLKEHNFDNYPVPAIFIAIEK